MKSWRIIGVLVLCLVLAGAIACSAFVDNERRVGWQLAEVVRGDLAVSVSGSGNIEVSNEQRLAFGVGGRIDKIYVKEGDKVSRGDGLARLDTSDLELALTQARVALTRAQLGRAGATVALDEAEYLEELLKGTNVSDELQRIARLRIRAAELQLEEAEQSIELARQSVRHARKQLDQATVIAPFDGVVASVGVDEGDTVSPATTIVHLIDLTSMELEVTVWERDIPMIRLNQRAIIEVDAFPEVQLKGRATFISLLPTVEAGVILYKVKIGFDIPQGLVLKVGMSAEADIVIDERSNVLLVPNRAIKRDAQGNPIVEVMVNEQIKERLVVIGISDGFVTEIVDGLDEGEIVVIER